MSTPRRRPKELRYGDTATLEAWIDDAYKTTMKRLMDLMGTKFHLFEHLQALKNYILLGQGDFIALLMESLAANLDRPAGAQYRHTLTAQLEHAIRGSNAQYDSPEVLRRLDARMLQLSHGDIGWDCFTLEYKIDAPVERGRDGVGEPAVPQGLQLPLAHQARRVRAVVHLAQVHDGVPRRPADGGPGRGARVEVDARRPGRDGTLRRPAAVLHPLRGHRVVVGRPAGPHPARGLHARRPHPGAHAVPQRHHAQGPPGRQAQRPAPRRRGRPHLVSLGSFGDLLRTMLAYRDSVDGLYSWSVSDFTRRQEADLFSSHDAGPHAPPRASSSAPGSEFPVLRDRLGHLASSFRARLQILLGDLAYQPDVDMRFLGVAMNFNDVYQPARRKVKGAQSASKT